MKAAIFAAFYLSMVLIKSLRNSQFDFNIILIKQGENKSIFLSILSNK